MTRCARYGCDHSCLVKIKATLCPPKPKELLMAAFTGIERASLGT